MSNFLINIIALVLIYLKQSRVSKGQTSLAIKVDDQNAILNEIWSEKIMKNNLTEVIQKTATESLKNNIYLQADHKNILFNWSEKILEFSKDAYFTRYRRKSGIEDYLRQKSNSIVSELENYMLQAVPETIQAGKKQHSIIDFLHTDSQVYQEIEIMIRTLVKNGLDDMEYIELFESFTSNLLNEGQKTFMSFHQKPKITKNN